jgi:2-aminomuconate deaminase
MKKDFPIYNKIYAEYFTLVQACRTTVEVKSMPTPIAIELKVIATID